MSARRTSPLVLMVSMRIVMRFCIESWTDFASDFAQLCNSSPRFGARQIVNTGLTAKRLI